MKKVLSLNNGPDIMAVWGRDTGTMERRLKLAVRYPNGEISPIREYQQSKLTSPKALRDLADLDGVSLEFVEKIYQSIMEKKDTLQTQSDGSGKCSLLQAYRELCEYVRRYEEPGRIFIKDGYGNILSTYLQNVLDKLELGYTRLEIQKNFKVWDWLRSNEGTGHVYAYKINTGSANNWYFSFKLSDASEVAA